MICKKCANIFDDSLLACPMCGWSMHEDTAKRQTQPAEPFRVVIKDEDYLNSSQQSDAAQVKGYERATQIRERAERKAAPPTRPVSFDRISPDGIIPPKQDPPTQARAPERSAPAVTRVTRKSNGEVVRHAPPRSRQRAAQPSRPVVRQAIEQDTATRSSDRKYTETVYSKRASSVIVSMVCILALIMGGLTAVSAKTDVFKAKSDTVKTVALSSISGEDSGSLEKQLSSLGVSEFYKFDSNKTTPNEFLSFIRPYDSDGLYARLYKGDTLVTGEPDPASRFIIKQDEDEQESYYESDEESYSYYKIPEAEIDRILGIFNLPSAHTANSEDYYYHNGYYYFANKTGQISPDSNFIVDVTAGKRIEDGRYYVECSRLYSQSGSSPVKSYLIVEKGDDSEMPWIISKISTEPVFASDGTMYTGDDAVHFTMQTQTIEAVADDGTVYCRYTVRYPSFQGDSGGEKTASRMFSDMINQINTTAEKANENYQAYISCGGDKSALPFISETVAYVSYNDKGYISLVKETADNLPDLDKMKEEYEEREEDDYSYDYSDSDEEEIKEITFPKRTFEGYNLDKQTGDFVTKDNIISKDYRTAYELLYRIYNSYDYTEITDALSYTEPQTSEESEADGYSEQYGYGEETEKQYEEVPEDEDEIGKMIYDSANALCDEGYAFFYVTEEGYAKKVVIPYDIQDFFVIEQ